LWIADRGRTSPTTYIPHSWKEITDYARALWAVVRRYIPRSWSDVLDFAHILWVIRIPVCALAVGFALLCLVPQAQDLLVELIEYSWHVASHAFCDGLASNPSLIQTMSAR
jgi:hypothetical protein